MKPTLDRITLKWLKDGLGEDNDKITLGELANRFDPKHNVRRDAADELFDCCLNAHGIYRDFWDMAKILHLEEVYPGFEGCYRDLEKVLRACGVKIDEETHKIIG